MPALELKTNKPVTLNIVEFKDSKQVVKKQTNKKRGTKSEVYPFEIEDIKKLANYFEEHKMWTMYLIFMLSCNLARRVGDMLMLTWEHFYNPNTGNFRHDILEIVEDKTDKLANPHINSACKDAINKYIAATGCDPSENGYKNDVFIQLSGTHKGKTLTQSGYLKALKAAGKAVGIEYNIGTHSPRKTFGMLSRMLHPSDYDSMEVLQTIYNHNDTKTTKHYIGLTKKKMDKYYNDVGDFFGDYITGDKVYDKTYDRTIVNIDLNDLRSVIRSAYESGKDNAGNSDPMVHVDAINNLMEMLDKFVK